MPEANSLLLFMLATITLNVTPGPDMLYVIARSGGHHFFFGYCRRLFRAYPGGDVWVGKFDDGSSSGLRNRQVCGRGVSNLSGRSDTDKPPTDGC